MPRVAVVSDLREEQWHAMDLVAEMLLLNLRTPATRTVDAAEVRPHMTHRLSRLPLIGRMATARTADRILNRVWDYPRWLAPQTSDFDLFHIVDHSYAHLATRLPAGRTVITCHDVDAFRGVLPGVRGGSIVERALGRRLLEGMLAAGKILCCTAATREQLMASAIVPPERVVVVQNGVHPSCNSRPDADAEREAAALLGGLAGERPELLHVGSTISRKRIDVLLHVVAAVRRKRSDVRLIRVGGPFTPRQQRLAERLGLTGSIAVLPFVKRRVLAAIYRRAALLLQTSDREGFGLPVAEAMTCGTPVVASDLPALLEVGGPAATYCPVADTQRWTEAVLALLEERADATRIWGARQSEGIEWAKRFDWQAHAAATVKIYREVLDALPDRQEGRTARPSAVSRA